MSRTAAELSLDEELMILMFWAQGIDILQRLGKERVKAIPELQKAIEAVSHLPHAIGWDDEPQRGRPVRRQPRKKQAASP